MAEDSGVECGIRSIDVSYGKEGAGRVTVDFGPHYGLDIESDGEKTWLTIVATHHGFRADASSIGTGLEAVLEEVRRSFPDLAVD